MRNPLWILNLGLVFLFIIILGIMFFTRHPLPARKSLTPPPVVLAPKKVISPIDLSRIYENDLFKTYQRPVKQVQEEKGIDLTVPRLPQMKPPPQLQRPQVHFLDPLKINLKGILSVGDEKDDRVIIEDEKTRKEELYAVGDTIEDAEILRIDTNKVIFVRSNGQEETLFLTASDAALDPIFTRNEPWGGVVQKISNTSYTIDVDALKDRITSPAEFIDQLDLTAAVKDSRNIGCRVGQMAKNSIGHALGLMYNDAIISVNNMPVSSTKERVAVYQSFMKAVPGAKLRVKIIRGGSQLEYLYILKAIDEQTQIKMMPNPGNPPQQAFARAPVVPGSNPIPALFGDIQKQDKLAMRQFGGRSAFVQRPQNMNTNVDQNTSTDNDEDSGI